MKKRNFAISAIAAGAALLAPFAVLAQQPSVAAPPIDVLA